MHQTKLLLIYPPYLSGAGAPPPSPPAGRVPARVSLREAIEKKMLLKYEFFPKGGGSRPNQKFRGTFFCLKTAKRGGAQWAKSGGQAQIKESTGQCQLLVLVTMFIVFKNIILVFLSPFLVFLNVFSMCFWVCFIVSKLFCECVSVLYYP